jgi:hypothetical protein
MARNLKNEADETTWEDEDVILHRRPGNSEENTETKTNAPSSKINIDYSARPGATRLPVATQTMHYSKRDFLRIQYR